MECVVLAWRLVGVLVSDITRPAALAAFPGEKHGIRRVRGTETVRDPASVADRTA